MDGFTRVFDSKLGSPLETIRSTLEQRVLRVPRSSSLFSIFEVFLEFCIWCWLASSIEFLQAVVIASSNGVVGE
ncbi:hypothetical protein J5N97_028575 [Dioscorea zingiberensis]|uniref:Uncharacterized protein n=1 Tax=Dioscorea zingiberensis TaxID=325984 RepID=A0A9D5H4Y3_9LILI|nr:hypothetical protein J5N97_028575 [Dioscorea zingiberensis]